MLAGTLTACGAGPDAGPTSPAPDTAGPGSAASPEPPDRPHSPGTGEAPDDPRSSAPPRRGTEPPSWLGTRVLPLTEDGFGEVLPTPPVLRVRRWNTPDAIPALPGRGFQALLVHGSAAADLVAVFRQLYRARFPIEAMGIARRQDLDAAPTGDGNTTGSFACRPVRGGTQDSQHAYGLAVDLDPFQNPYVRGDVVLPELASAYLDRDWRRPGMVTADGPAVRAFASIGWRWGGTWSSLKDDQHVSRDGR